MSKIINFNSYGEFDEFIKDNCTYKIIGQGGEGKCLLGRDEQDSYKVFERFGFCDGPVITYDVSRIITVDDIALNRYVLPSELYALKGILLGYKTKYIKGEDLFSEVNLCRLHNERNLINFEHLISSYQEMRKETDILSKEKISLFDISCNIMFVNNNLYGIDTCGYGRVNAEVFDRNRRMLDESFIYMFEDWLMCDEYVTDDEWYSLSEEKNVEKYFKKLEKVIARR